MRRPMVPRSVGIACLVLALGACTSSGGGSPAASESPGSSGAAAAGQTVGVKLQEWAVVPDMTTLPAGTVTFDISNTGPEDEHEFVVLRTDLPAAELPTADTGAVDEESAGIEVVDEVEEVPVNQTASLTVDLDPGHYVLLCNVYSEEEHEAHYRLGMRSDITVE